MVGVSGRNNALWLVSVGGMLLYCWVCQEWCLTVGINERFSASYQWEEQSPKGWVKASEELHPAHSLKTIGFDIFLRVSQALQLDGVCWLPKGHMDSC